MISGQTHVRVRYGEVDQMGFLYYGNYALYYEVARSEMIRDIGYPYSDMEKDGTLMPVVKMNSKFLKPARYDELIRVETTMIELPRHDFVTFYHKLFNEENELINKGEVTLTFFNPQTQRRVPMPDRLKSLLLPYFPESNPQFRHTNESVNQ
jgi:acyl-CoA thioester hydrolase